MAKRFIDTAIWEDEWYQSLSIEEKLLWRYLVDRCDAVGFYKKNLGLATYQCGFPVTNEAIKGLNKGKNRVIDDGEYLEIVDFIKFQYGTLTENCNPHKKLISMLEAHRSRNPRYPTSRVQEQDKEKEEESLRGIVKGESPRSVSSRFFSEDSNAEQEAVITRIAESGVPEAVARREIKKFVSYWTEPNQSGTKRRWEQQKTFELSRRLATWFSRITGYQENKNKVVKIS
jgi:hypothetical protein